MRKVLREERMAPSVALSNMSGPAWNTITRAAGLQTMWHTIELLDDYEEVPPFDWDMEKHEDEQGDRCDDCGG